MTTDLQTKLRDMGLNTVEEYSSGPYSIYLIYYPMIGIYQLSLTKDGADFTTPSSQKKKLPGEIKNIKFHFEELTQKIIEWKNKYENIYVGSFDQNKVKKYKKLLNILNINTSNIQHIPMENVYLFKII